MLHRICDCITDQVLGRLSKASLDHGAALAGRGKYDCELWRGEIEHHSGLRDLCNSIRKQFADEDNASLNDFITHIAAAFTPDSMRKSVTEISKSMRKLRGEAMVVSSDRALLDYALAWMDAADSVSDLHCSISTGRVTDDSIAALKKQGDALAALQKVLQLITLPTLPPAFHGHQRDL